MPQIKYSKKRIQNGEICMTPEREAAILAEVKLANVFLSSGVYKPERGSSQ